VLQGASNTERRRKRVLQGGGSCKEERESKRGTHITLATRAHFAVELSALAKLLLAEQTIGTRVPPYARIPPAH
jgi:hypothetical protein